MCLPASDPPSTDLIYSNLALAGVRQPWRAILLHGPPGDTITLSLPPSPPPPPPSFSLPSLSLSLSPSLPLPHSLSPSLPLPPSPSFSLLLPPSPSVSLPLPLPPFPLPVLSRPASALSPSLSLSLLRNRTPVQPRTVKSTHSFHFMGDERCLVVIVRRSIVPFSFPSCCPVNCAIVLESRHRQNGAGQGRSWRKWSMLFDDFSQQLALQVYRRV
jgi:hypothetical protein